MGLHRTKGVPKRKAAQKFVFLGNAKRRSRCLLVHRDPANADAHIPRGEPHILHCADAAVDVLLMLRKPCIDFCLFLDCDNDDNLGLRKK